MKTRPKEEHQRGETGRGRDDPKSRLRRKSETEKGEVKRQQHDLRRKSKVEEQKGEKMTQM